MTWMRKAEDSDPFYGESREDRLFHDKKHRLISRMVANGWDIGTAEMEVNNWEAASFDLSQLTDTPRAGIQQALQEIKLTPQDFGGL